MEGRSYLDTTVIPAAEKHAPQEKICPVLTIISHPDLSRMGEVSPLNIYDRGKDIKLSRVEPEFSHPGSDESLPLIDAYMSRDPILLSQTRGGDFIISRRDTRTNLKVGGMEVDKERAITLDEVREGIDLVIANRIVLLLHHSQQLALKDKAHGLRGGSDAIARVWQEIDRICDLDVSVLLRGETGTGKELLARAIHETGVRNRGKIIAVNLGAIPSGLAAAELFGTERGAFPGALRTDGYFREANGGTLFLDEVGEAASDIQTLLLRVLESGEIYAVGSRRPTKVNVRLIAATDANLEVAAQDGTFKAPLLHRLSTYEIWLPPLRDRLEDLGRLIHHFAKEALKELGNKGPLGPPEPTAAAWFPALLAARMCRCLWPGNVRQLRNIIRQLVIRSRDLPQLQVDTKVERQLQAAGERQVGEVRKKQIPWRKPGSVSPQELKEALNDNGWDLKATAAQLHVSRTSLYALLDKTPGINKASDLLDDVIRAAHEKTMGQLDEMAADLQVSARALRNRLKRMGLN